MTSMLTSLANDRNSMWFYFAVFVHFKSPLDVVLGLPELVTLLGEWLSRLRGDALRNGWEIRMWMFLVCSHTSGARCCCKSLSDHKTIEIRAQAVSVPVQSGFGCSSALLFKLAVCAGLCPTCRKKNRAVPQEENLGEHMVQTLPGLCKCGWGDPWRVQHMDGCSGSASPWPFPSPSDGLCSVRLQPAVKAVS